jgi:RNA polymerase sigma factor (sigma-70 family)
MMTTGTRVNDMTERLSNRERQIIELLAGGLTGKEVAFELGIADSTVRVLHARARKKLQGLSPNEPFPASC